jgi:hypothetical protein
MFTFGRGRPPIVAPRSINLFYCNKFRLRRKRRPLAEGPKKHLPFARIANHYKPWDPHSCGTLSVYIEGCVANIFHAILVFLFSEFNCLWASAFCRDQHENGWGQEKCWSHTRWLLRSHGKTNVEKITNEILSWLSGDSSDSESFDIESENENAEDRPWRPSHVVFGKSTIKQGQIEAMKGKYFHDVSVVRAGGEDTVPLPEGDEVVIFRSFWKSPRGGWISEIWNLQT